MGDELLWSVGADHTRAELDCLVRLGALEHVLHELYCPRGRADELVRAAALRRVVAPRVAAGSTVVGPSAAWVMLGGTPPERLHVAVAFFHRTPPSGGALRWTFTQTDVAAGANGRAPAEHDVHTVAGLRITTPERTVEDLLLTGDPVDVRRAVRLLPRTDAARLRDRLAVGSGRRRVGAVAARSRLEALLATLP